MVVARYANGSLSTLLFTVWHTTWSWLSLSPNCRRRNNRSVDGAPRLRHPEKVLRGGGGRSHLRKPEPGRSDRSGSAVGPVAERPLLVGGPPLLANIYILYIYTYTVNYLFVVWPAHIELSAYTTNACVYTVILPQNKRHWQIILRVQHSWP